MARVRNRKRSANRKRLRHELFPLLSSDGRCSIRGTTSCTGAVTADDYEVHHVDGCTWNQRAVNAETRWYRYRREHRQGIHLAAACRSCNGAFNQTVYGTRDAEVPF